MGMTTAPARATPSSPPPLSRAASLLPGLAWASLVANVLIVVTGGAVRLTGSGLGCPTWPRCTDQGFRPHGELQLHQAIEFSNRMLTFALLVVAVATLVAAWRSPHRRLAVILLLGIPLQAVIGGISVLTELNPWVVSLHLLVSMAMVGVAVLLLRRIRVPATVRGAGALVRLAGLVFAAAWLVLYLGTVVTGSGPHAGDVDAPRNGLSPLQLSQAHADSVFLFVGLTVGLLVALRLPAAFPVAAPAARAEAQRAVLVLLVIELAQGTIGFVQYFTGLPEILVGFHMFGAALISAAVTWLLLAVLSPAAAVSERAPA